MRPWRSWAVFAAAALAAVVVLIVAGGLGTKVPVTLGADNAGPSGARAVLAVLARQGVRVETASSLAQASAEGSANMTSTVAIYDPNGFLTGATLQRALSLGARTVLIGDGDANTRDSVEHVGDAAEFENGSIANGSNAANAIRTLGAEPVLIWYLPSPLDIAPGSVVSVADATPGWVTPVIVLAALVALAAAIWRGRRFGPLLIEELPVVVTSRESLEGHARLYRRSRDREHAARMLRIGALGRLSARLGLPREATAATIADAVADATGRGAADLRADLVDAVPVTDRDLDALAARLAELEASVTPARRASMAADTTE